MVQNIQEQTKGNAKTAKTTVEVEKKFVSFKNRSEKDAAESALLTVDIKETC